MSRHIYKCIFCLLLVFSVFSCGQGNTENSLLQKGQIHKSSMYKQPIYGIDFNIATPFEILVNDALVIKYNEEGSMSGFYPINELLINNKDQEISIRIYSDIGKEFIEEDISKYFSLKLVLSKNVNFEHFKEIQNIKIPEIIKNTPYIEYKYHFNIEVPYQLEGWINSVDLTKENKEALLKEVKIYILSKDLWNFK